MTDFRELRAEVLFAAKQHGIPAEKIKFDWLTLTFTDHEPVRAKRDSDGNIVLHIAALMFDRPADPVREALDYLACFKATPKTLYVNRPLLNGKALVDWAKAQGFPTTLFDLHVTIAFSRAPVDWSKFTASNENLEIKGGERSVEALGETGDAAVLRFESADLTKRWNEFIDGGASWDWPSYEPHVTISFKADGVDLSSVEPYDGTLVFGPEEFAELKEDWKDTVVEAEFDESKHPRDDHGRWTDGGGGDSESSSGGGEGKHPGEGYSASARLINGVIHTSSVYDAQRALYEGRKVELNQPRQVTILLDRLAAVTKKMVDAGEKAPTFNLCNVTVKGTNLFCADSKGIPRVQMPQMDAEQTKAFRQYLKDKGYKIEKTTEEADHLRATQNELNGAKVAKNAQRLRDDPDGKAPRLVVSKDNYILDGHHRWAAKVAIDAADNKLGDEEMKISRVNISITKLLEEAEKFTGGKGKVSVSDKSLGQIMADFVREYDESKHPRDESGKWTDSGGGELGQTGGEGPLVGQAIDEFEHKYGLNEHDQKQLYSWMGSGYQTLRTNDAFGKTLEKLPPYSGRVYRGTRVTDAELKRLQPGTMFTINKFSSSSMRSSTAAMFTEAQRHDPSKKTNVIFEIDDKGRRIPRDMAAYAGADENEVVLMRGDRYRIKEVETGVNEADERPFVRVRMSQIHD